MPGKDGTGPIGCEPKKTAGLGQGVGYRRGPGKNFMSDSKVLKTPKEILQEQKKQLESKLDIITKQLERS